MDVLKIIDRKNNLFSKDFQKKAYELKEIIQSSRFLILGAAGSIGQAVSKLIFAHKPKKLHLVDLSENNLTELVRDIRSDFGYIDGEFQTFCLDIGSISYDAFFEFDGNYDYVLNLSALKHVRSEKDPFTLMQLIDVNIGNTSKTLKQATHKKIKKYFCVSTDKATDPANMMGASKLIMEMFLMRSSVDLNVSTSRFANVAFSDGSLLYGFEKRLEKRQPIAVPSDIKRYFITAEEAGKLCVMSCIFGENRDIFFPNLNATENLVSLTDVALRYLQEKGYEPYLCSTEKEARILSKTLPLKGKWPCFFSKSDTTGEKKHEEFYTDKEIVDMSLYQEIGIIKNSLFLGNIKLAHFEKIILDLKSKQIWSKDDLVHLFKFMISNFEHDEVGKYLDGKM